MKALILISTMFSSHLFAQQSLTKLCSAMITESMSLNHACNQQTKKVTIASNASRDEQILALEDLVSCNSELFTMCVVDFDQTKNLQMNAENLANEAYALGLICKIESDALIQADNQVKEIAVKKRDTCIDYFIYTYQRFLYLY